MNPPEKRDEQISYTFMHVCSGPTFRYIRTENIPPYVDIIGVFCSPWAMANWALQYSECVDVLEPKKVRDEIARRSVICRKCILEFERRNLK